MAERLSPRSMTRNMYTPEDNPEYIAAQEYMSPEAKWRRNYEYVLKNTNNPETARIYADSIAATETRQAISGAAPGLISGGVGVVNALRGVGSGRNAMTAAEMLAPETRALPAPRPGPSSPVGRGVSGEPIPGTSAERMPRLAYEEYKPDFRGVPDELAMLEGEGGMTSDAIAEARRLARERLAAERAFRQQQISTMEGEGGGAAQAAADSRAARASADRAAMDAAINAAENEGMGAAIGAGRRQPGTSLVPAAGRDVVPTRTAGTDLEALMDRHFGGGSRSVAGYEPPIMGEIIEPGTNLAVMGGGRGAGYTGPMIEGQLAGRAEGAGIPAWLRYGAPAGAALAGGTYLASGRDQAPGQMQGPPMPPMAADEQSVEPSAQDATPSQTQRALQLIGAMPISTQRVGNVQLGGQNLGFGTFNKPAAASASSGQQSGRDYAPNPPARERGESRGFLERLIGQPSQSMGGNLIQDGKINWGSGESAADFVRASQAMRKMQDEGQEVRGINPELEMDPRQRKSGGSVDGNNSLDKALSIIHHLVKR